jgi:hypothetical protein
MNDPAIEIRDDHAFVNGVENRLEESLFVGEPEQVVLNFLGAHAPETFDEFIEEAGIHRG